MQCMLCDCSIRVTAVLDESASAVLSHKILTVCCIINKSPFLKTQGKMAATRPHIFMLSHSIRLVLCSHGIVSMVARYFYK